ncbi:PREDICTED: early endosome antigen 1-like, partial [Phaethon lepturus]|uniref:early endosome antigen 1-like n=1 Tax=Phaethon lepturus TaxID=97097 RepID=UPI000530952C
NPCVAPWQCKPPCSSLVALVEAVREVLVKGRCQHGSASPSSLAPSWRMHRKGLSHASVGKAALQIPHRKTVVSVSRRRRSRIEGKPTAFCVLSDVSFEACCLHNTSVKERFIGHAGVLSLPAMQGSIARRMRVNGGEESTSFVVTHFSPPLLFQTPGRGGSQSSDSDSSATPGNAVDVNNESSSEGFICPLCMKSHGSAEELFKHYEAVHNSGIDSTHGGEGHLSLERDEVSLLRQEVQDLQASLKEERWYSEELKKELEKLQGQRQQDSKSDGLTTATSTELSSLERQLEEIQVENFNIKQMKDLFEQKAAQLATEIVDLKSKYDEEISLREGAEQKVTNLTQELQKERSTVEDLKTELLQRPGVEDVAVLKKELVQVQTLMDKMTLERERESEKLKDECKHLQAQQANSEATINQLRAELAKGPQEVAVYVQELQKLQSSVKELEQKNQ